MGKPEECRTIDPPLNVLNGEHKAACHYAAEALKTDVGIAHLDQHLVRRGTPDSALAMLKAGKAAAVTEAEVAAEAPAAGISPI